jgi:hypothetical protein
VKLEFDIDKPDRFWTVRIYTLETLFEDAQFDEPLNEEQYQRMADWCAIIFRTQNHPYRARRMSYDSFWFSSKRDLDWFILHWSGVDSDDV